MYFKLQCQLNEIISSQDYKDNLYLKIGSAVQAFKNKDSEKQEWQLNVKKIEVIHQLQILFLIHFFYNFF